MGPIDMEINDYFVVESMEILKIDRPGHIGISVGFQDPKTKEHKKHALFLELTCQLAIEFGTVLADRAEKRLGESLT